MSSSYCETNMQTKCIISSPRLLYEHFTEQLILVLIITVTIIMKIVIKVIRIIITVIITTVQVLVEK
jgi:hypothetical protein